MTGKSDVRPSTLPEDRLLMNIFSRVATTSKPRFKVMSSIKSQSSNVASSVHTEVTKPKEPPRNDSVKCPVTGFTDREKSVLQQSWKRLIGSTPKEFKTAGINLLLWMFDNVPDMRNRFTKFSAKSTRAALIADEMFLAHTQSVILTLDALIKMLYEPFNLEKKIRQVARAHLSMTPSIGTDYFRPFQEKFHLFVEAAMGLSPNDEEVKLWTIFLAVFCAVVEQEERILKPEAKKSRSCCIIL